MDWLSGANGTGARSPSLAVRTGSSWESQVCSSAGAPEAAFGPRWPAGQRLIEALRAGEMFGEAASSFGTRSRGSGSVTYGAVLEGAQETTRLGGAKGRTGPPPALS